MEKINFDELDVDVYYCTNITDVDEAITQLSISKDLAIDIETYVLHKYRGLQTEKRKGWGTALDPHMSGIALITLQSEEGGDVYIIDSWLCGETEELYTKLRILFKSRRYLVAFNAPFECKFLLAKTRKLYRNFWCCQAAVRLVANATSNRFFQSASNASLAGAVRDYFGVHLSGKKGLREQDWTIRPVNGDKESKDRWRVKLKYAVNDVVWLFPLKRLLNKILTKPLPQTPEEAVEIARKGKVWGFGMEEVVKIEMEFLSCAAEMEYYGLPVSLPMLNTFQDAVGTEDGTSGLVYKYSLSICQKLNIEPDYDLLGNLVIPKETAIMLRSPKKLKDLINKALERNLITNAQGKVLERFVALLNQKVESETGEVSYANEDEANAYKELELLENSKALEIASFLKDLIELKRYQKQQSMNLISYVSPVTGRIHASYNTLGASTGRLSSSNP